MKTYLLLPVFAAACSAQLLPPGLTPPAGSKAPSPASSSAAPIKPDTVVATIAGISVTAGEVEKMMTHAPQNLTDLFKQNPELAIGTAYQMEYLTEEAEKQHLDQREPTKDDLESAIAWQKRFVLANAMINQVDNGYQVDQPQIEEFYKSHESRYQQANIKIILIGFKPALLPDANKGKSVDEKLQEAAKTIMASEHPLNERSEAEAKTLADSIVKQLRAGAKFGDLVQKYSDDTESKASGGDFGTPIKATSSFAPEIKKAVFDLKPGEISEPLRQANSYYIIRLENLKVQPLTEVGGAIAQEIRNDHMHDVMNDLNKRFTPQVVRPDFFIQAQKAMGGGQPGQPQGAAGPPAPNGAPGVH